MRSILRRLARILGQDRIRLPRRPLRPTDIAIGDRLQIGLEIWCVSGAETASTAGDNRCFELASESASELTARLIATGSPNGGHPRIWLLVRGGDRLEVPPEMIVAYPSGPATGRKHP